MKGKSFFLSLVLGWSAITAVAHTEHSDSLAVPVAAADTSVAVVADSVVADSIVVDSLAAVPVAINSVDSLGVVAVVDSLAATDSLSLVPDSLSMVSGDDYALDSLGLLDTPATEYDSLGHEPAKPVEPVKVMVVVPDSIVAMADSIFAMAGRMVLPESVSALADSVEKALRPMMLVDSTEIFAARVKALFDVVEAQVLYEAELARLALPDTLLKVKYSELLTQMRADYEGKVQSVEVDEDKDVNPLLYRLFAPLTLYKNALDEATSYVEPSQMEPEDSIRLLSMSSGRDARLQSELNRILLATYLSDPRLVVMLEDTLMLSQGLSEQAIKNTSEGVKLNVPSNIANINEAPKADLTVDMKVTKPNFWKTKGTFSMQFTESYFTENWYQGGANNINMLSTMTLEANYNNKRKVQWNNRLEARIGFYQNEGAEIQSNQDLLRATSSLNLKAIRNWNYTVEAQGNTQMMQHFQSDKVTLQSRFFAPVDGTLTIGMSYSKGLKKGSLSVFPGPLSYKITYVAVPEVAARYNFEDGKSYRDDIGSKLEVRFDYKLAKDISYNTRFYYFTGRYEYVQMDWENTFNFQMNKHLSAKFFFHARFDDSRAKDPKYGYLQFKEYLTFGLNYTW